MNFIKKLFGDKNQKQNSIPGITVEKILHVFQYGKLKNLIGTGSSELANKKVGDLISWKSEAYFYKGYKDIPAQNVPPHISWSKNPVFAYLAIVDEKVQYHYGESGESAVFICPITTNAGHIELINEIFHHYYNTFNLPESLSHRKPVKPVYDKSDKMKFLAEYLTSTDEDFFYDNFYEDTDDIVMCIDWREEDENIIICCEDIIQSGELSVKTLDSQNERGFEIIITYKNSTTNIPYKGDGADRNTTIKTLNKVIGPDYEIRLCKESLGNDTLLFLPLTNKQWIDIDEKYKKQVESKFLKIADETQLF